MNGRTSQAGRGLGSATHFLACGSGEIEARAALSSRETRELRASQLTSVIWADVQQSITAAGEWEGSQRLALSAGRRRAPRRHRRSSVRSQVTTATTTALILPQGSDLTAGKGVTVVGTGS